MRSKFGQVKSMRSGWIVAEYRLDGVTTRETFSTQEEAAEWLESERAAAEARRTRRGPKRELTPPEEGGAAYPYLFTTGVKPLPGDREPSGVIAILPPALSSERQRIESAVGRIVCPEMLGIRVSESAGRVLAFCGSGIAPHERRTLWDILIAAADRQGYYLDLHGKLGRLQSQNGGEYGQTA